MKRAIEEALKRKVTSSHCLRASAVKRAWDAPRATVRKLTAHWWRLKV